MRVRIAVATPRPRQTGGREMGAVL